MKISARIWLALTVLVGALLVTAASATADPATRTTFTGTDFYQSETPGTMWVSGQHQLHLRGSGIVYEAVTTDSRVSGIDNIVVNGNFTLVPGPVAFTGPMWGTFHTVSADGYWDGIWTGVRDENGFAYIRAVGHGGGGFEGLKLTADYTRLSPDSTGDLTISGEILDPGGSR